MTNLRDAGRELVALVELLRLGGGFDLTADVRYPAPNGPDAAPEQPRPELIVELSGPDSPLLIARNGELLHAIEHLAAKILGLQPEEHDRICFDTGNFKAERDRELHRLASTAIATVRTTAAAYVFPPMMSRERRILHLALAASGLRSASSGKAFHRCVILYPDGVQPPPE